MSTEALALLKTVGILPFLAALVCLVSMCTGVEAKERLRTDAPKGTYRVSSIKVEGPSGDACKARAALALKPFGTLAIVFRGPVTVNGEEWIRVPVPTNPEIEMARRSSPSSMPSFVVTFFRTKKKPRQAGAFLRYSEPNGKCWSQLTLAGAFETRSPLVPD